MLTSVKKIGPILELFSPERPEWRLTDVARELDMPKSTVHDLLESLVDVGLLATGQRGRYRLGSGVLSLSERMRAALDFRKHALADMQALSDSVLETVALAVLERHEVVYVERVEGRHPRVRLTGIRVGTTAPAHSTAVGKVLLANCEPDAVRLLMDDELRPMTRRTITDMETLERELVRVRARGFAVDLCETAPDIACVAAPIRDRYETVVAALSVCMPAYRFEAKRAKVLEHVRRTSTAVSERLRTAPVIEAGGDVPFNS